MDSGIQVIEKLSAATFEVKNETAGKESQLFIRKCNRHDPRQTLADKCQRPHSSCCETCVMRYRTVTAWVTVWLGSMLITFSRRPGSILNAQFWSEDGRIWYADAYNFGPIHALLLPHTGYLQTIPRLAAAVSLLLPLSVAPLFFNIIAIIIQSLPVMLLCSNRFNEVIPRLWHRLVLACLYLTTASGWEIGTNITNAQWHVALMMFMVLIASRPKTRWWKVFDVSTLVLGGLTGPFCIVLLPMYVAYALIKRRINVTHVIALGCAFVVQGVVILTSASSVRFVGQTGISIDQFVKMISGQVIVATALGIRGESVLSVFRWGDTYVFFVVFIIGVLLILVAWLRGPIELKFFLFYSSAVLAAALISPSPGSAGTWATAWQAMAAPGTHLRYYFLPILSWLTVLSWLVVTDSKRIVRDTAFTVISLSILLGVPLNWVEPPLIDMHFQRYVSAFQLAPVGTHFNFPQNPPEWRAPMTLVKK